MGDLTAARLRELLHYDPASGVLTWHVARGTARAGDVAGSIRPSGHRFIRIDGRDYAAHRLAWLYVHSVWPVDYIDHKNGDPADNRLSNLRDATRSVNMQNQRAPQKNGTSGYLGVSWHKAKRKWAANIRVNGTARHIVLFSTPESAHEAYLAAKREHHPGCTI